MAYIRYESRPGEEKEFGDVEVAYDDDWEAFVFEIHESDTTREAVIPRERVYGIEYDKGER